MTRKIIEYYLTFVVETNFEAISKQAYVILVQSLRKLNLLEVNLGVCYRKVDENKNRMGVIRSKVIDSTAKFLLYKQKLKNMLNIYSLLKNRLLRYIELFRDSKKLKSLSKYATLYKNMSEIQTDIQKNLYAFKKRNLIINDILLMKSKVTFDIIY
jgi:hypothetical protein